MKRLLFVLLMASIALGNQGCRWCGAFRNGEACNTCTESCAAPDYVNPYDVDGAPPAMYPGPGI